MTDNNIIDSLCVVVFDKIRGIAGSLLNGYYALYPPSYPMYPLVIIHGVRHTQIQTVGREFHDIAFLLDVRDYSSDADRDRCIQNVRIISSDILNIMRHYSVDSNSLHFLITCYDLECGHEDSLITDTINCRAVIGGNNP